MTDKIYQLVINSAKVVGMRETLRGLVDGTIRCVIVAVDCDDEVRATVRENAKIHNVPIHYFSEGKKKLGALCGIEVSCAVVGILKTDKNK